MRLFKKLSGRTKGSKSKQGDTNESVFATSSVQVDKSCAHKIEVVDIIPLLPDSNSDKDILFDLCDQSKSNEKDNRKKMVQLRNFIRHTRPTEKHKKKAQKELNGTIIPTMTQSSDDSSALLLHSEDPFFHGSNKSINSFRQASFSDTSVQASGSTLNSTDSSTSIDADEFLGTAERDDHTVSTQSNFEVAPFPLQRFECTAVEETESSSQQESSDDFSQNEAKEHALTENIHSKQQSNLKNSKFIEPDAFHVLNELLVLENQMVAQDHQDDDNVKKVIEGVISRRLQREFIVCNQSYGDISDIEPSFSDTDSIWTSISQCTTSTAKISNRKRDHLDKNHRKRDHLDKNHRLRSAQERKIKDRPESSPQPDILAMQESQPEDKTKSQMKGTKLADEMRTIFDEILQTKYLKLKPSSAALLLKENLEYAMQVAGFAKNDNQRFIFAPASESNV
jgi:hypothetical protein